MLNKEKNFSPGASVHISGLHLYAFLSPNLNFYACRSKMLNVTLIHRTNSLHNVSSDFDLRTHNGLLSSMHIPHRFIPAE